MIPPPPSPRQLLINQGVLETGHLLEGLRVDFPLLLNTVFPGIFLPSVEGVGITQKMRRLGEALLRELGPTFILDFQIHPSDTIRGLVCYGIGAQQGPFENLLHHMKPLADDPHFGVREWAWIALREPFLKDIPTALTFLEPWVLDASERVRRFACELTRPRGVWCAHSAFLRKEPWHALSILEPLKSDPSVYVQKSVGNWLNDASKDQPQWVRSLAEKWGKPSPSPETRRILKRGLRSLSRMNP